jgi:hypothetical protein
MQESLAERARHAEDLDEAALLASKGEPTLDAATDSLIAILFSGCRTSLARFTAALNVARGTSSVHHLNAPVGHRVNEGRRPSAVRHALPDQPEIQHPKRRPGNGPRPVGPDQRAVDCRIES